MHAAAFLYMPVIHSGYLNWIEAQRQLGHDVYLISEEFAEEIDIYRKDLRALPAEYVAEHVAGLAFRSIPNKILTRNNAPEFIAYYERFVFADEDVSDHVIAELFAGLSVERVSVFLRYDRKKSLAKEEVTADRVTVSDPVVSAIMTQVVESGMRSSDWWIQVGAALVRDGKVELISHNEHVPNPNVVDALGSVRGNWKQGVNIDLSTALHAEGALFAEALRLGVSFSGADLYVSTFPCPYCAPIVAHSGIRRLFFKHGYSMIEGQELFRSRGIEIIRVAE